MSKPAALYLIATMLGGWIGSSLWTPPVVNANHTACNQYDGGAGNDTYYGTDACDEFWMRDGHDSAWAYDNPCCSPFYEELHMGTGADTARGGAGQDYSKTGDNPSGTEDVAYGGAANDVLLDGDGPDDDRACGGDGEDQIDLRDGDGRDNGKGEGHPYSHQDVLWGDSGDILWQDGTC